MNALLSKKEPEKSLLKGLTKTGGRNFQGRITIRHRGGGVKRLYRVIDFDEEHLGVKGKVAALEYDPNRNCFIALVEYEDGKKGYVLAPHGMSAGQEILCDERTEVQIGNRMRLQYIPVGTMVHAIELEPGKGGKLVRSAGGAARITAQESRFTHLVMSSSEIRKISSACFASIGMVSNPEYMYQRIKKAGTSRLKGKRPQSRGKAMNPVDHPHGGGEGRNPIGLKHPKTPWGKPALGVKTRDPKRWTSKFILQRRQKKRA